MRRIVTLWCLCLLMSAGLAGPAAAEVADPRDGADVVAPQELCDAADGFTAAGYPGRALALLADAADDLPDAAPACPEQLRAAVERRAVAEALAFRAGELDDPAEAVALVADALVQDQENADALALEGRLEGETSQAGVLAAAWTAFAADVLAPLGAVAIAWAGMAGALLVLARLLTGATVGWPTVSRERRRAVVVAGLLALAWGAAHLTAGFAAAATQPPTASPTWPAVSLALVVLGSVAAARWRDGRFILVAVIPALLAAAFASLALLLLAPSAFAELGAAGALWFAGTAGAVTAVGVAGTTVGLATRLRIVVEVRGDAADKRTAAGHVVALLDELGSQAPAGLETPEGTDVSTLANGALAETPTNKVAAALVGLLRGLLGVAPWRVVVDEESADVVSVVVTRNGRKAQTAVIERESLGLGTALAKAGDKPDAMPAVDLHRMVAAVVMTTLARYHRIGFEGLCGASQWRGLGFYFIATTEVSRDRRRQVALLSRAVDDDPGSWLAQVAWVQARYRGSTLAADHRAHYTWLNTRIEQGPPDLAALGFANLALRLRLGRALVAVNRYFAEAEDDACARAREDARRAVGELQQHISESVPDGVEWGAGSAGMSASSSGLDPGLLRQIMAVGAGLLPLFQTLPREQGAAAGAGEEATGDGEGEHGADIERLGCLPFGPRAYYALGCSLVAPLEPAEPGAKSLAARLAERLGIHGADDVARGVEAFELATGDPHLREWIAEDPQLRIFRKSERYRAAFGATPRASLLAIEPFAAFADALTKVGASTPESLAALSPAEMQSLVPIPAPVVREILGLARLRLSMTSRLSGELADLLSSYGVEVLDELRGRGLARAGALRRLGPCSRRRTADEVSSAVVGRCGKLADKDGLSRAVEAWIRRVPRR